MVTRNRTVSCPSCAHRSTERLVRCLVFLSFALATPELSAHEKKVLINSEPKGAKVVLFRGEAAGGLICRSVSHEGVNDVTPCSFLFDEAVFDPMGRYWERSKILGVPLRVHFEKGGFRPADVYLTPKEPSTWQGKDVAGKIEKKFFFITQDVFEVQLEQLPDYPQVERTLIADRFSELLRRVNAVDALGDCKTFYEQNEFDKAITACNVSLGLSGQHPDPKVYHYRCLSNYRMKRYSTALTDCEELIRLEGNNDVAWSNVGLILQALGRYSDAVPKFSEAIRLNPQSVLALRYRAVSYARLDETQDAIKDCEEALKLAPRDPDLIRLQEQLRRHAPISK
jgi:tetratricopeptide (TPR) repeat protein